MADAPKPACRVVRAGDARAEKQGLSYAAGIATETVGSTGLCMHVVAIPPGARAKAHLHESHESAIYVLSGEARTWYGERLEHFADAKAGDMMYVPAGVPHLPVNLGDAPCVAVIARTDPSQNESVVLLPELDDLVD